MTKFTVRPEALRRAGEQLRQHAQGLNDVHRRASRTYSGMNWQSERKLGIDQRITSADRRVKGGVESAEQISQYLIKKAEVYLQADQQSAAGLTRAFQQHRCTGTWSLRTAVPDALRAIAPSTLRDPEPEHWPKVPVCPVPRTDGDSFLGKLWDSLGDLGAVAGGTAAVITGVPLMGASPVVGGLFIAGGALTAADGINNLLKRFYGDGGSTADSPA